MKINWKNLRNSECPKCANLIKQDYNIDMIICRDPDCNFKITPERMKEVLNKSKFKPNSIVDEVEHNLEMLNEL